MLIEGNETPIHSHDSSGQEHRTAAQSEICSEIPEARELVGLTLEDGRGMSDASAHKEGKPD